METNQQAIDTFFEGYGTDTVKEYGKIFFDLMTTLRAGDEPTAVFLEDVTSKLSSVFALISDLKPSTEGKSH